MNPYESLPESAFWKPAIANRSPFDLDGVWQPKFPIRKEEPVATFGSCFAQYIGRAMRANGFDWLDAEQPPQGLREAHLAKFGYGIFSARTGNIYTTSLLKQWTRWALNEREPPHEVWEKGGRFYDPFRPNVESGGFDSPEEVRRSLERTVLAFRGAIERASFFVFTLGLTESWINHEGDYEYPMCPGTVAGEFDSTRHEFVNQSFGQILKNLSDAIAMMREINPGLRFLLTVSPVPLTATRSGRHVMVATTASKSILRAVSDQLATVRDYVDYFPSYELISAPPMRGMFFEPNQRNVNPRGVAFVMESFFTCLAAKFGEHAAASGSFAPRTDEPEPVCEEELLQAFAR